MVGLFWLSSQPDLPDLPAPVSDKAAHFTAFFVLAALLLRAVAGGRWAGVTPRAALAAFGIAAGYGALDEFHQMLTPGRFPAMGDWLADVLGALTALALGLAAAGFMRQMTRSRGV
jgi:VanZ family protein